MTNSSSNQDNNLPVRRKIPRPETSPPDMPTNCRFKPGQIVRLLYQCGAAMKDSIGIVDYYLPKNYSEEGVCWVHFYDTFYLDLMTEEEPKSPGIQVSLVSLHWSNCTDFTRYSI